VWHVDGDELREPVGVVDREPPADRGPPVVAGDRRPVPAVGVDHPENVAGEFVDAVVGDRGRLLREVVSALVRHDDAVARARERSDRLVPAVPELRKAVEEDEQFPVFGTGLDDV
jgi:hypothetical protein